MPADPKPLRSFSDGLEGRAAREIELMRQSYSWPLDRRAATWWSLRGRAAAPEPRPRPQRRATLAFAFAGACAALAVIAVGFGARHWLRDGGAAVDPAAARAVAVAGASAAVPAAASGGPAAGVDDSRAEAASRLVIAGDLGTVEVTPSSSLQIEELPAERQLRMWTGTLRAQIAHQRLDRPVVVITPHLRVVVVGTRFDVRCDERRTTVDVLEGLVRVETAAGSVLVAAGESVDSDDPRLQPPPPPPAQLLPASPGAQPPAPPSPSRPPTGEATGAAGAVGASHGAGALHAGPALAQCDRLAGRPREDCLRQLARGKDLAAQNALFSLGLLAGGRADGEEALAVFRQYDQRFHDGVLAPEVALRELELLQRLGREQEAAAVAAGFEERFADDPRAPEVALVRASILCRRPGGAAEALAIFDRVGHRPELRDKAARLRARCEKPAGAAAAPVNEPAELQVTVPSTASPQRD